MLFADVFLCGLLIASQMCIKVNQDMLCYTVDCLEMLKSYFENCIAT